MSWFNVDNNVRYKKPEDANRHELNKYAFIYRLGDSANWKCSLCKRIDDLPAMLVHHTLVGWPCRTKWEKMQWDEEEKKNPSVKIDPNNYKLDDF